MSDNDNKPEEQPKQMRRIRSFVKREGRMTQRQSNAKEQYLPTMGLTYEKKLLDLDAVFGRQAPRVLEVGFGMGKSLVEMAKNNPDYDYIGIEVHGPGVGACLADAAEAGITNLRVFEHDAVEVLADMIPDNSLSTFQLYFPDPWHKARHHKRRIVQPEFLACIHQKLVAGGIIHMATDWENYAEHMLLELTEAPGFENTSETQDYVPRPDWRPLTKFESRGHRLGHGVWDLIFKKVTK
ncbi:tRNA (guanosine(46)-N7)-methyltransferase TrmB [Motilimonas cestriensis]|uniref:tRNA (guanine-N(7)-)-methyltransferase n=1 Tax=Motilimonas cestriensis TaxID=2742685 RepID=A0ABS8WB67_9GAMM|nr:tRNA (guanosine(46)-N7)-methyltransferase TrmB [Motilimonas cestriensis]MCE2596257.1 tRNA (guanosine(46)-N7)-methyltransferase TrmB [Motilimonas cestriensis]